MAQPIAMKPPVNSALEATERKLESAPLEHADAVLSAYQLLQEMHDTGTLDLLRGAFGAGDAIVNHMVQLASQPEMVRGIRNLLIVGRILGNINPDTLHGLVGEGAEEPPSLLALMRRMNSPESRRGLAITVAMLEAMGSAQMK